MGAAEAGELELANPGPVDRRTITGLEQVRSAARTKLAGLFGGVDPVRVTSLASSPSAVLSWASMSRGIEMRCLCRVRRSRCTGSVTAVVSKLRQGIDPSADGGPSWQLSTELFAEGR